MSFLHSKLSVSLIDSAALFLLISKIYLPVTSVVRETLQVISS